MIRTRSMFNGRVFLALCALLAKSSRGDVEFDLLFRTNLDEMENALIEFDSPPPHWLQGSLIRNGLGRYEMGHRNVTLALDAYAKLAKWTFTGGNNTKHGRFSTKFVQSVSYTKSVAAGDIVPYMMLGPTNPPFATWQVLESMILGADNMNVNIFNYGDGKGGNGYVITSDFWNVYEIDATHLKTVGPVKPPLPGAPTYEQVVVIGCAHALPEYGTKNHITFASLVSLIPGVSSKFVLYRTNGVEGRSEITTIESAMISYMHSFGLTHKRMIVVAQPLYVDPLKIFRTLNPIDGFKWEGNKETPLYVVDLETGFVKQYQTENLFFLHSINAFEDDDGKLVLDLCVYKNSDALWIMQLANLQNATTRSKFRSPTMKRYVIDPTDNTVSVSTFPQNPDVPFADTIDFPTINENFRFKKYCYVYGVAYSAFSSDFLDMALVKKDICTGKGDKYWYKNGSMYNEAYFVQTPGATEEDDGVLLVQVLDTKTRTSQIVILDARTLQVASSALLPTNIPFGTHGRFFPEVS